MRVPSAFLTAAALVALLTEDTTPPEPGVVDHKYYVRGVGNVKELTARGPRELAALTSVAGPWRPPLSRLIPPRTVPAAEAAWRARGDAWQAGRR